jgi:transcriptional regulator with GAF, ATPase, and Fis domain
VVTLEIAERDHILRAVREANGLIGGAAGAAARLGMKRKTLQPRMKKLGMSRHLLTPISRHLPICRHGGFGSPPPLQ